MSTHSTQSTSPSPTPREKMRSKITWATGILVASSLFSKALGVFRDILLADLAGIRVEKNAYDLAFMIPDMLNHLISTGYLSITFIPLFTGLMSSATDGKSLEKAWRFFSNTLNCFLAILIPLTALAWFAMEPLLLALTQKAPDPETLQLAVSYSRIILPAQLCFFVGALLTALQHYHMRFFLPALSGLIYNGAIILGGYLGRSSGLEGFAWGVFGGAFVGHFLLQGWGVLTLPKEAFHKSAKPSKAVRRYFWSFRFTDPLFIRYLKLTLPLVVGVGPLFALEFLYRSYGPIFGTGGIAQLGYAYRIMYTVVSVFGFSVGVASYPYLAKLAKQGEHQAIQNLLFTNLGRIFSLLSPVLLILWFAAEPITQTLFERGAFSPEASRQVALLLQGFLMASIGMSSHVLIVRCFYAYEKMWLPALLTSGVVLATLPLYDWLAATLGIQGIPIAASISTSVMVLVLFATWMYIQRSQNVKGLHTFLVESLKVLFCFIVSFGILHFLFIQIESVGWKSVSLFQKGPTSLWKNALQLGLFSAVIFLGQFTLQRVFRVHAAKDLTQRLFKKWF